MIFAWKRIVPIWFLIVGVVDIGITSLDGAFKVYVLEDKNGALLVLRQETV